MTARRHRADASKDPRALAKRFLAGQRAARDKQDELLQEAGAEPEKAVAECLELVAVLERQKLWPGPRDPATQRDVERVRAMWAKAKRERASAATT